MIPEIDPKDLEKFGSKESLPVIDPGPLDLEEEDQE